MNYRCGRQNKQIVGVVGRIIASEDVHILRLGAYDDVTLHGKGELQLQMELRLLIR